MEQFHEILTTVKRIKNDGSLGLTCMPEELIDAGCRPGDIICVEISKRISLQIPFVEQLESIGLLGACLCDFGGEHLELSLKLHSGSFAKRIGGDVGEPIKLSFGSKTESKLVTPVMPLFPKSQNEYASDCSFGNFRMVSVGGIAPNTLFRGCSPINPFSGVERARCVDVLCAQEKIKTIINLADSIADIQSFLEVRGEDHPFTASVLHRNCLFAVPLGVDFFDADSTQKISSVTRFMLQHKPPFYIHCNEGKDRTGIMVMLLECLMGASVFEMEQDYLTSYTNLFHVQQDTATYYNLKTRFADRILFVIAHPDSLERISMINWNDIDREISNVNFIYAAEQYFIKQVGLMANEVVKLQELFGGMH